MIIYSSSVKKFLKDVDKGISSVLNNLMAEKLYKRVGKSEIESWNSSLGYVSEIISNSVIPMNSTITLEYNLPMTSKRIDLILSGYNEKKRETLILFELKQWSSVELLDDSDYLVQTFINGGLKKVVHPAYQVWSYLELFKDFNSYIQQNDVILKSVVLLHNYDFAENDVLLDKRFEHFVKNVNLYGKNNINSLKEFLEKNIKYGDDGKIMDNIDKAKLLPSVKLQENIKSLMDNNQYFKLLDEQIEVFDRIISAEKKKEKSVIIVNGKPGTGKSIVAVNLLSYFIGKGKVCQFVSRNTAPRVVYSYELKQSMKKSSVDNLFKSSGSYTETEENVFDVLLVDEAHCLTEKSGLFNNYGENQIKEIINSSRVSVFFVDEKQRVHLNDIGTIENIKNFSDLYNVNVVELELKSQFRCSGSDNYLNFVDYILQISDDYNGEKIDYNIKVIDSPKEMINVIKRLNTEENARVLAGYCWDWNKKEINNPDYHDIVIDDFEMSWNLGQSQTFAIDKSINEAGCIHSVQGLEFDYVGVIVGKDLEYNDGKLCANCLNHASTDPSLRGIKKLYKENPEYANKISTQLIKNAYRVLLTRGIKGCFVYCVDKKMNQYFKEMIEMYTK